MKSLENCTVEELEMELKHRNQLPRLLAQPDTRELKMLVSRHVSGENIKDYKHYIYEAAMESFYGKDIWVWLREKRDSAKAPLKNNFDNIKWNNVEIALKGNSNDAKQ